MTQGEFELFCTRLKDYAREGCNAIGDAGAIAPEGMSDLLRETMGAAKILCVATERLERTVTAFNTVDDDAGAIMN